MVRYTDSLEIIAQEQHITFVRMEETIVMGSDAMGRDRYKYNTQQ